MQKSVLVYVDHFQGTPVSGVFEAIGVAKSIASQKNILAIAVVVGRDISDLVNQLVPYNLDKIMYIDHPDNSDYCPERISNNLRDIAAMVNPDVIIFPTTTRGREIAAILGVDLETGVVTDVIDINLNGDTILATRSMYSGKVLSIVSCTKTPLILTLRLKAFEPAEVMLEGKTLIQAITPQNSDSNLPTKTLGYVTEEMKVNLQDAGIIVAGGRGLLSESDDDGKQGATKGFELLRLLAEVVDGQVGSTRPLVDSGLIDYSYQVGQTGTLTAPNLLIAVGVSGAIHFLAGVLNSKIIVSVNNDPDAPIFTVSNYGIVRDLYSFVPALIGVLKEKK